MKFISRLLLNPKLPGNGKKKVLYEDAIDAATAAFLPIALKSYVGKLEDAGMKVILLNPETQTEYDEAVNLIAIALGAKEEAQNYFNYRDVLMERYITDTGVAKKRCICPAAVCWREQAPICSRTAS